MATGRIGVTPVLRTRWSKQPSAGTTSLSGLSDNSISLVYDVSYEAVYRNGVLLSRGNDYTATDGTTVTLIDATLAGDIIEIFANDLIPLTDAIGKGQYSSKAALLSATAASTPAVLTVGANDTVLTADSSTATGLKWATPSSGGMTLLSTTTLSGASTTISGINQTYTDLQILILGANNATGNYKVAVKPNATVNLCNYSGTLKDLVGQGDGVNIRLDDFIATGSGFQANSTNNAYSININNYANATNFKPFSYKGRVTNTVNGSTTHNFGGAIITNNAITSLEIITDVGSFTAGTVLVYGVK